jgi:hypothetical protein
MSDLSTIVCPHKQELYVRQIDGVSHYSHQDREDCSIFNSFVVTVQEILDVMGIAEKQAMHSDKETIVLRTAFICSLPFRLHFYQLLSKYNMVVDEDEEVDEDKTTYNANKLSQLLAMWSRCVHGAYNERYLDWEIGKVFGKVVFDNLVLVTTTLHKSAQDAPETEPFLPHYMMLNIKDWRENAYIQGLDEDAEFNRQRSARFSNRTRRILNN